MSSLTSFISSLLPRQCLLCGGASHQLHGLCEGCYADLPWNINACQFCAMPLPGSGSKHSCGHCLDKPPVFQQAIVPMVYGYPVDYLVKQAKFHHKLACARSLGEILAKSVQQHVTDLPDLIIPVPLHPKRLRQRGFNQAIEIARPVSRVLSVPVDTNLAQRVKMTEQQSELALKNRHSNTQNAFRVKTRLYKGHVAIIDDVMTSGQTVSSLASELIKQGVEQVSVWCPARTSLEF